MSQDTDLASSSFHGSYGLDLFPSDLESSQQTIESTPASELLHPMISSSLERFGNDWIVYSEMSKENFIFWWLQTIHGNELRERNKSFWDRSRSHSEAWNSFKQVAHTVTGDPKIVCQKCGQLLDHPSRKLNGTTPMARHLRGEKCQRLSNRVAGNSSLQELFARQARDYPAHEKRESFTKELWQQDILTAITGLRLPFLIIENPLFQRLLQRAQSSPLPLEFPSAKTIQCQLRDTKYRELLLEFEPLHGSHTGVNLGTVLFEVLQRYQLVERVLAVTTDNASNNQTLVGRVHEQLESLNISTTTPIIRVPCIAHVIQLSLKSLLGYMKLEPVNEATQREWSENQSQSLRASQRKGIISTLSKVRGLAVFINASPQRRDTFRSLQIEGSKLLPIQDVKTRWNSTFLMLRRAKRLQLVFNKYCSENQYAQFTLDRDE
ncbi:hypothetical protein N7471_010417 [Penicillium samsonianum]|uniref:uncharacterized protein n=1 Tax=Penicillium samsonianum TaxID=1882272 RepID=UPI0025489E2D|nr:uncharacterized protein N7471_010417 [Penicillium samsonianum]KAJ6125924.1 hypothetical protein N7471_010417 [Penicillium samsonianum]